MAFSMQVDIVSAEGEIFSGKADMLFAQAANGEIGILPHHSQFLSQLKPGTVRVVSGDEEDHFYINGGIIEIQPSVVTASGSGRWTSSATVAVHFPPTRITSASSLGPTAFTGLPANAWHGATA